MTCKFQAAEYCIILLPLDLAALICDSAEFNLSFCAVSLVREPVFQVTCLSTGRTKIIRVANDERIKRVSHFYIYATRKYAQVKSWNELTRLRKASHKIAY